MKKEQAHKRIDAQVQAGLISIAEARAWRRQIEEIDATDQDQEEKELRFKIWAS